MWHKIGAVFSTMNLRALGIATLATVRGGAKDGYFRLIAAAEPFLLLFPLGFLIGVIGVLLWPACAFQWWQAYLGAMHPRSM